MCALNIRQLSALESKLIPLIRGWDFVQVKPSIVLEMAQQVAQGNKSKCQHSEIRSKKPSEIAMPYQS